MNRRKRVANSKITAEQKRLFGRTASDSDDDKTWFLARPQRTVRVRLASAAEAALAQTSLSPNAVARGGPNAVIVTLVKQLAPGARLRKWCVATDLPLSDEEWGEGWGKWAWEQLGGDGEIGDRIRAHLNAEQRA
jgi:hypothetical protein